MTELAPGQACDHYQILDVIARSGMATIFRATDVDGRVVALKVPHLEYARDIVFHERFLREEQIGQRLDHPGVIKVFRPHGKSRMCRRSGRHRAPDCGRARLSARQRSGAPRPQT